MTDPVNGGAGGPTGPDGPGEADDIEETDEAQSAEDVDAVGGDFSEVLADQVGAAGAAGGAVDLQPLQDVVNEVAGELQAGTISGPGEALEQIIERFVDVQFEHLEEDVRQQMAGDLEEVLAADPYFVFEVEELISRAMEQLG